MYKYSIIILSILLYIKSEAANIQSDNLLTHKDTLFLTFKDNGDKFIKHTIKPSQTYFSIATYYGMDIETMLKENPKREKEAKVGESLIIHIPNKAITRFRSKNFLRWKYAPICYEVKKGDNLFNIAKVQFRMTLDSITKMNNLKDKTIKEGMKLLVGWFKLEGIQKPLPQKVEIIPTTDTALSKVIVAEPINPKIEENKKLFENLNGYKRNGKGKAFWQKNKNTSNDFFCMHRTARVNSVIKILNPMTNKTAYAKVIARMNDKSYSSNVIIVLSSTTAKFLGAVDHNFYVNIEFY
jgi:peptidoglycan DL-endopeptidase LytF